MESEIVEAEKAQEQEKLEFLGSLDVMTSIRKAQSQNGLKRGDYRRYRNYCTKKIKRIQKQMDYKQGKGKQFFRTKIEESKKNDPRLLQVLLYRAEQNWSYGMDIKQAMSNEQGDNRRQKHHYRKKFKRAFQWASKLRAICNERAEQFSAREVSAYTSYIEALLLHEYGRYYEALQRYVSSRDIFVELKKISDTLKNVVYSEKIEQMEPSIRYCYQRSGGSMFDSLEKILSVCQQGQDAIQQKSQTQQQVSSIQQDFIEVSYNGEKYPIKNKKIQQHYQNIQQILFKLQTLKEKGNTKMELEGEASFQHEELLATYVELFSQYDDAARLVIKDRDDEKNSEGEKKIYASILDYFNLQKSYKLYERNLLLLEIAIEKFQRERGIENLSQLSTKKAFKLRLTRPTEIVKLCDNLLQSNKSIMEHERLNPDSQSFRLHDIIDIYVRGVRCFFVATVYAASNSNLESLSLISHADNYFNNARKIATERKINSADIQALDLQLTTLIQYLASKLKIELILERENKERQINKDIQKLNIDDKKQAPLPEHHSKSVEEIIAESKNNEGEETDPTTLQKAGFVEIPPKVTLIQCKPIFLDIADSYISYPKLEGLTKQEDKPQNKGGFLNKFNFFKK